MPSSKLRYKYLTLGYFMVYNFLYLLSQNKIDEHLY